MIVRSQSSHDGGPGFEFCYQPNFLLVLYLSALHFELYFSLNICAERVVTTTKGVWNLAIQEKKKK